MDEVHLHNYMHKITYIKSDDFCTGHDEFQTKQGMLFWVGLYAVFFIPSINPIA
jgi:hypothetical protein